MLRRALYGSKLLRGPKKGKGGGKAEEVKIELSSDIINIFKDRSDPEVKPISEYPPWIHRLLQDQYHPIYVGWQIYSGEKLVQHPKEQRRIAKWTRRFRIQTYNLEYVPKFRWNPRTHDVKQELSLPGAEESDQDIEDNLEPYFRLSQGSSWVEEVEKEFERLRINLEPPKTK